MVWLKLEILQTDQVHFGKLLVENIVKMMENVTKLVLYKFCLRLREKFNKIKFNRFGIEVNVVNGQ